MKNDTAICVSNVSKKFSVSLRSKMILGASDLLRRTLGATVPLEQLRTGEQWALRDISFSVKKGDSIGIVGSNGSGKSTLLRMIYGIYPPDTGTVSVKGKIGALIAVGAGFHAHMTGRENIYLNGAILGLSREEVKNLEKDIVEFAGIGAYIDAPVSTYSSGMNIRLGFSISIHTAPEILLADEILAVGDLTFALKCYRKISEYQRKGGTIILVSHSLQLIRNACRHAIWIEKGELKMVGDSQSVCRAYENYSLSSFQKQENEASTVQRVLMDTSAEIVNVVCYNSSGVESNTLSPHESFSIGVRYKLRRAIRNPKFSIGILTSENVLVLSTYSDFDSTVLSAGEGISKVTFTPPNLKPGAYFLTVTFAEEDLKNPLDWHEKAYSITFVSDRPSSDGLIQISGTWALT